MRTQDWIQQALALYVSLERDASCDLDAVEGWCDELNAALKEDVADNNTHAPHVDALLGLLGFPAQNPWDPLEVARRVLRDIDADVARRAVLLLSRLSPSRQSSLHPPPPPLHTAWIARAVARPNNSAQAEALALAQLPPVKQTPRVRKLGAKIIADARAARQGPPSIELLSRLVRNLDSVIKAARPDAWTGNLAAIRRTAESLNRGAMSSYGSQLLALLEMLRRQRAGDDPLGAGVLALWSGALVDAESCEDPEGALRASMWLKRQAMIQGKGSEVIRMCERTARLGARVPGGAEVELRSRIEASLILGAHGMVEQALEQVEAARRALPDDAPGLLWGRVYLARAQALRTAQRFEEATRDLTAAVALCAADDAESQRAQLTALLELTTLARQRVALDAARASAELAAAAALAINDLSAWLQAVTCAIEADLLAEDRASAITRFMLARHLATQAAADPLIEAIDRLSEELQVRWGRRAFLEELQRFQARV